MNNSIFEILKMLNAFNNNPPQNQQNFVNKNAFNYYPNEAFSQQNQSNSSSNFFNTDNNLMPLIMSLLSKNNDLSKIFSTNQPTKEESKKENKSPNEEILL